MSSSIVMGKNILKKLNCLENKLFSNIKYNMNDLDDSIDQATLLSLVAAPVSAPASASAPRTHKKQATTHFKNYKASTKKQTK